MKYFMVCLNPECDQPLHHISGEELIVVTTRGVPVIGSISGDEPPVGAAVVALEDFLASNPEDKIKDMAYEKLKSLQAQLTEECTCPSCTEPEATESMGSVAISPTASDDYYQSAEYKAHRVRMEALEIERTKAEILNQEAHTKLIEAKARLTIAEAQKIELNLPTIKRVKPETN